MDFPVTAALKLASTYIEGNMTVLSNSSQKEFDPPYFFDLLFIRFALCMQIGGISVQDMDLGGRDVDYKPSHECIFLIGTTMLTMREKLSEHEGVIGFRVIPGKPNIFVHVERHDVLEPVGS